MKTVKILIPMKVPAVVRPRKTIALVRGRTCEDLWPD